MLMGDVGFATRSMLTKRSGRPRSSMRKNVLAPIAPRAERELRLARAALPVNRAPAASSDDATARKVSAPDAGSTPARQDRAQ